MKLTIVLAMVLTIAFACKKSNLNVNGEDATMASQEAAPKATATPRATWTTVLDGNTFSSYATFHSYWNYLYPWGSDHNGSARMYGSSTDHSQIYLNTDGSLTLKATKQSDASPSTHYPNLAIKYHSGAVYAKSYVNVSSSYPTWEISGDFKAPTTYGTWPAFWITNHNPWNAECDILEVKGSTSMLQNTYDGSWEEKSTTVSNSATTWHNYKLVLTRLTNSSGTTWTNNVKCEYYIDNVLKATHTGTNFANKSLYLIINLQMEGAGGAPGPTSSTYYYIKNVKVRKGY